MNINWFPGHMVKAIRSMQSNLEIVDSVIYILDSRAIKSCMNPILNDICKGKEILYLLNKIDLVEESDINKWEKYFKEKKLNYLKCVGTQVNPETVIQKLKAINQNKIQNAKAKGINYNLKAMVVGIPNSGKSSIINSIAKRCKTFVGNKASITRGVQWINIDNIYLLDTPGTLWGKIQDQQVARNLAFIGSINDDIIDFYELALNFLNDHSSKIINNIRDKYNLSDISTDFKDLITDIAEHFNYKLKGNNLDLDRTTKKIITDFRQGLLGKIMLDKLNE